jgi:hypothetical protein
MKTRAAHWCFGALISVWLVAACSSDDPPVTPAGGTGATAGTGAPAGGRGAAGGGAVGCGTVAMCPSGMSLMAGGMMFPGAPGCCANAAMSQCGFNAMGRGCMAPPAPEPRCPTVQGAGGPCCAMSNLCGVDSSSLGFGCVDFATLKPFNANAPAPVHCDGTPVMTGGGGAGGGTAPAGGAGGRAAGGTGGGGTGGGAPAGGSGGRAAGGSGGSATGGRGGSGAGGRG